MLLQFILFEANQNKTKINLMENEKQIFQLFKYNKILKKLIFSILLIYCDERFKNYKIALSVFYYLYYVCIVILYYNVK